MRIFISLKYVIIVGHLYVHAYRHAWNTYDKRKSNILVLFFNDATYWSDYIASNNRMISDWRNGNGVGGSGRGLT